MSPSLLHSELNDFILKRHGTRFALEYWRFFARAAGLDLAMEMGMIPTFIARFINSPSIRAMRHSLLRSEQEAVAYIAQLHQTGPGLYTAPARRGRPFSWSLRRFLPDRRAASHDGSDVYSSR